MHIFTVSLFGHRILRNPLTVERALEETVLNLLRENEFVEFLLGRNGDFDLLAASVIRRCRRSYGADSSAMILVLPYETAEYRNDLPALLKYYDEVEICEAAARMHFRAAMTARNREMVDRSDLVVCCVERQSGGAYQAIAYARTRGVICVNLAEDETAAGCAPTENAKLKKDAQA